MNSPQENNESISQDQTSLADAERTRHRLEIFNQLFRGILLVDSGAIVALFAYLQSSTHSKPLSVVILVGIFLFALSMFFSLLFMKYRYMTSEQDQFGTGNVTTTKFREQLFLNLSIGLIFIAILAVIIGNLCLL